MNDQDSLSGVLKTWRHEPHEEPAFNRGVWARISAKPERRIDVFWERVTAFTDAGPRWAMPVAACLVLLLSLATGSGVAYAYGSLSRNDRMAAVYARSIDPLQMPAR